MKFCWFTARRESPDNLTFVKPPYLDNNLPDPKSYLRSGLRYPDSLPLLSTRHATAPESSLRQSVSDLLSSTDGDASTVTPVDEHGMPMTVIALPSEQYLVGPSTFSIFDANVIDSTRTPGGFLTVNLGPPREVAPFREPAGPIDRTTARIVTLDKRVIFEGLDRLKFGKNDAIFVSAALQLELTVLMGTQLIPNGRTRRFNSYRSWEQSIPVSIDASVLRAFNVLVDGAEPDSVAMTKLDRTDLLCAATAIVYDAPLYTTNPDAYAGLKNGLRLLEYGPVRNKSVVRERERAGTTVVSPVPPAPGLATAPRRLQEGLHTLSELEEAFKRGGAITEHVARLLDDVCSQSDGVAEFVNTVLSSFPDDWDPTWRIALLERAEILARALASDDTWHADILSYTSQLTGNGQAPDDPLIARQSELALKAIAIWGRWPEDISEDVLFDLSEDPGDERLLNWYRVYLSIAGLSRSAIEHEVDKVRSGQANPSIANIDRLRRLG